MKTAAKEPLHKKAVFDCIFDKVASLLISLLLGKTKICRVKEICLSVHWLESWMHMALTTGLVEGDRAESVVP